MGDCERPESLKERRFETADQCDRRFRNRRSLISADVPCAILHIPKECRKAESAWVELFRPRFQFGVEEIDDAGLAAEPQEGLAHHVSSEKGKKIEILTGLKKRFGKLDGMLEINVVVGQAVDEQEWAAQV
jgi:hypothetical protein